MAKTVALVGHCSPDSSFLTMTAQRAWKDVKTIRTNDDRSLTAAIAAGVDLLLVNRAMEPGFPDKTGVELIARLKKTHPDVPAMLVSNYEDAQAAAIANGALPGFGKSDLMDGSAVEVLRKTLP